MKISICMPVMGRARMLEQALYSLLLQEYQDWELVVRDGDPDNPVFDVLRTYAHPLLYTAGRDRSIIYAFNDCLSRATGDIVHFMCSDDLMCPGALGSINEIFEAERYPMTFWLYGQTVSADARCKKIGVDGGLTSYNKLLVKNRIGLNAVFASRALLNLEAGFDVRYRYAADYDLWLRLWRRREPLFLAQELGVHRHHDEQASRVHVDTLEREARMISERNNGLGDVVSSARVAWSTRHEYGGEIPESRN